MKGNRNIVLAFSPLRPVLRNALAALNYDVLDVTANSVFEENIQIFNYVAGIITSNAFKIDSIFIDSCIALKWIGRLGSGMEIIDVKHAEMKGIKCFSTPGGNANAVAEHALGMYLSLKHNIVKSHVQLLESNWERQLNTGSEIESDQIGIIGYGNNGRLFTSKLLALGCSVFVYDKYRNNYGEYHVGLKELDNLEEIFEHCNVISFHVPADKDTYHYFSNEFLHKMKRDFTLLNLSRGNVVDIKAVNMGLDTGKVLGAGIDVFEVEPPFADDGFYIEFEKLIAHSNVIATPHIAGYTYEATDKMNASLAEQINKFVTG